ncbi:hypothetical protein DFH27DRAFT_624581 [Peziza echinospora]|nr:hypothetical protein DFH27DRAFT_624581 [Peziza echinospora]
MSSFSRTAITILHLWIALATFLAAIIIIRPVTATATANPNAVADLEIEDNYDQEVSAQLLGLRLCLSLGLKADDECCKDYVSTVTKEVYITTTISRTTTTTAISTSVSYATITTVSTTTKISTVDGQLPPETECTETKTETVTKRETVIDTTTTTVGSIQTPPPRTCTEERETITVGFDDIPIPPSSTIIPIPTPYMGLTFETGFIFNTTPNTPPPPIFNFQPPDLPLLPASGSRPNVLLTPNPNPRGGLTILPAILGSPFDIHEMYITTSVSGLRATNISILAGDIRKGYLYPNVHFEVPRTVALAAEKTEKKLGMVRYVFGAEGEGGWRDVSYLVIATEEEDVGLVLDRFVYSVAKEPRKCV